MTYLHPLHPRISIYTLRMAIQRASVRSRPQRRIPPIVYPGDDRRAGRHDTRDTEGGAARAGPPVVCSPPQIHNTRGRSQCHDRAMAVAVGAATQATPPSRIVSATCGPHLELRARRQHKSAGQHPIARIPHLPKGAGTSPPRRSLGCSDTVGGLASEGFEILSSDTRSRRDREVRLRA